MERRQAVKKERFCLIDSLRGLALVNMIAFHLCYNIFMIFGMDERWAFYPATVEWERYICFSFMLISGISLNFSRRAYRRGLTVSACGALISLVTRLVIPEEIILFGVLTCIGLCMILTQAARRLLERAEPFAGAGVCLLLFAFFYGLPQGYLGFFGAKLIELPKELYCFMPLALLGLPDKSFYSSDYFPLLPWLFLYVCGFFAWRALEKLDLTRLFKRGVPILDFCGKYSLPIYMLHQPLLMGICFLIFK